MSIRRKILRVSKSRLTIEGAGVRLKRAFAQDDPRLDPFLLLDDFHSSDPRDYMAGFPRHPHRGIETITYMLRGSVAHGDSMGNKGVIGPGDVQWMTAGSGIVHEEMPQRAPDVLQGFQLWANLPAKSKMMAPRYREVLSGQIPEVRIGTGALVKVICGQIGGVQGAVRDIVTDPSYFDVTVGPSAAFSHAIPRGHNAFAYTIEGGARFDDEKGDPIGAEHLVIFDDGDEVRILAGDSGARFLLVSGRPLGEPVAWQGPIVMNTQEELRVAFEEYQRGTFIK